MEPPPPQALCYSGVPVYFLPAKRNVCCDRLFCFLHAGQQMLQLGQIFLQHCRFHGNGCHLLLQLSFKSCKARWTHMYIWFTHSSWYDMQNTKFSFFRRISESEKSLCYRCRLQFFVFMSEYIPCMSCFTGLIMTNRLELCRSGNFSAACEYSVSSSTNRGRWTVSSDSRFCNTNLSINYNFNQKGSLNS